MAEFILPPAPNWFSSGAISSSPRGFLAYASHNQILVLSIGSVPEGSEENWREDGSSIQPPKSYIIHDAHEEKTKVVSVAWCPDPTGGPQNQNLVSSGDDGTVRIWRWSPESFALVGQHTIHTENRAKVFGLDWSRADSNLVVSADETGCLVGWDLPTSRTRKYFFGKNCVFSLALHPEDPDLAAFGCKLGLVFVVSLAGTGRVIHKMRGHDEDVYAVSWCPVEADGDWRLVSSSRDKTLRVWSHSRGSSLLKLKLPQGNKSRGFATPSFITCRWIDESKIMSSGEAGELLLWNLEAPERKEGFKCEVLHREHSKSLFSVCVAGSIVLSVGQDRTIPVFSLNLKRLLYDLPTLNGYAYCLAANPVDPGILALGGGDGIIRVWKTGSKQLFDVRYIKLNQCKVMSLAWHPSREGLLAFGTDEGRVGWVDALAHKNQVTFSSFQHRGGVYCTLWGPGIADEIECALYTVGDGKLIQHNTRTEKFTDVFLQSDSRRSTVSQAVWKTVDQKSYLALGLEDGTVDIYLVPGLRLVVSLKSHKKLIQSLAFHPDYLSGGEETQLRNWLATASNEFNIHLWSLDSTLTSAAEEPVILVTPTGSLEGHFQRVIEVAWSPHQDGRLVSVSYDSSAQVWDVKTLSPLRNFQGHSKRLMCCMWHPSIPGLVLTGGEDCFLAVWDPDRQTQTRPIERRKKKIKPQNVPAPELEVNKEELSFEELLEQHKQSRLKERDQEQERVAGRETTNCVERTTVRDTTNSFMDNKKKKRMTKRFYFPVFTKTEPANSGRVGDDCLQILRSGGLEAESSPQELCNALNSLGLNQQKSDSIEVEEGREYLGFFCGRKGMQRLLEAESLKVEDMSTRATIALWTGNLAEALRIAEAEGSLNESMVGQAAGLSQAVWRRTAAAYALQLSKEGNHMRSSEYYLAAHMVLEAIEVLRKNSCFQPALAIALSRLPEEDPLIPGLMKAWALQCLQDGNLSLAAKCWAAAGERNQAAEALAKVSSRANLRAAAVLSEDPKRSEIFAKQCFTDCLFSLDTDIGFSLAETVPSIGWGAVLLCLYSELNRVLTPQSGPPSSTPLFHTIRKISSERKFACDSTSVPQIQQFVDTTTSSEARTARLLRVSGLLSQAYLLQDRPQDCLRKVSYALEELHTLPLELERLTEALFPRGTQPPEVGEALIFTPLHCQCNWAELRSIQCSEALQLLHSKVRIWSEELMYYVADAFMLEDVIFCQKISEEISEGEEAIAAFDPEAEARVPVNGTELEQKGEEEDGGVDFTPSLLGTQTVSLGTDGNWKSDGLSTELPLPPQGLENLPPPPTQTSSFHTRFLKGRADTVEATKEIQKLRFVLSRQNALSVPYPDLTHCCILLLKLVLNKNLGGITEEEEEDKKIPFSKKLARFGYYKGARKHQQFFLEHS